MRKVSGLRSLQRNQKLVGKVGEVLCIKTTISSRRNAARFKVWTMNFVEIFSAFVYNYIRKLALHRKTRIAPKQ